MTPDDGLGSSWPDMAMQGHGVGNMMVLGLKPMAHSCSTTGVTFLVLIL